MRIGCLLALFSLALFTANGQAGAPDLSFSDDGYVLTKVAGSTNTRFEASAIQSDGKIIAAGSSEILIGTAISYDFVAARYNQNGSLDPSFGTGGIAIADFDSKSDQIYAMAIQKDGKIVVAGRTQPIVGSGTDCAIARFNINGTLDNSFGNAGKAIFDFSSNDQISSIAIQEDGRIVLASSFYYLNNSTNTSDFLVARLKTNGTLDDSFGNNGKVITDFKSGFDFPASIKLYADGKILVAGDAGSSLENVGSDFGLVRYNHDGSLDNTFGSNGKVTTNINSSPGDAARCLAINNCDKIVAGGWTLDVSLANNIYNFAIVQYNSDGTLDPSFGNQGIVVTDFGPSFDFIKSIAIHNNKIIVAGTTLVSPSQGGSEDYDFAIARYNANGTLDATFGSGGKVQSDFSGSSALVSNDVQPALSIRNNRMYVAGFGFLQQPNGQLEGLGIVAAYILENASGLSNVVATPALLWPPNHKMREVILNYETNNNCPDSKCTITISSNEKQNGLENGDVSSDWEILSPYKIRLRAERFSKGRGRIYTIKVSCKDDSGNEVSRQTTVTVPKNASSNHATLENEEMPEAERVGDVFKVITFSNPAYNYFTMQINSRINQACQVKVVDVLGRMIEERNGVLPFKSFQLGATYHHGTYYAVISQGKIKKIVSLVKLKK